MMSAALVGGAFNTLQIQEMSSNLLADGSASGAEAVVCYLTGLIIFDFKWHIFVCKLLSYA